MSCFKDGDCDLDSEEFVWGCLHPILMSKPMNMMLDSTNTDLKFDGHFLIGFLLNQQSVNDNLINQITITLRPNLLRPRH